MNEQQLLKSYVEECSQEAFRELVLRNTDLVYGAARRQLSGSAAGGMIDEVTQAVFIILAKKARYVRGPVAGWLIRTTYLACKSAKRMARRREFHERRAMESKMEQTFSNETPAWETYAPILDQSLMELGQKDRDTLTLRYFKGMPLRDIGEAQGITEDAARKRVERALQRLRGAMLRKTAVPGAAILASVLATRTTEAAPAYLLPSLQVLHAAPASIAIAKTTTSLMVWMQLKVITALALVVLITLTTASVAWMHFSRELLLNNMQTLPIAEKIPMVMQPTDKVQIARWNAIFEEEEIPILAQLGKPVATKSTLYDARIVDGPSLRRAVMAAQQKGTLAWASKQTDFVTTWDRSPSLSIMRELSFDGNSEKGRHVMIIGSPASRREEYKRIAQNRLSITLEHNDIQADINELTDQWRWAQNKQKSSIFFQGELLAGDALFFIGKYVAASGRAYFQVVAWESFIAPDEVMGDVHLQYNTAWWCEHGPAPLQQWANDARVWNTAARHDMEAVPSGFEKKLEDGKTVRLLALSRPSQWPWCWWDAKAQPVKGPDGMIYLDGDPPEGLWAAITVSGPISEAKLRSAVVNDTDLGDMYNAMGCNAIPDAKEFQVGFLVGPWKELGVLQIGTPATFDGAEYLIDQASPLGPASFLIHYRRPQLPDDEVCLIAIDRDGKQFEGRQASTIVFGRNADTAGQIIEDQPNFNGIKFDNVAQFKLVHRKREWVTFTDFSRDPQTPPQTHVTLDMAIAAERVRHERLLTEALNDLAAKRQAWNTIPANQKTEHGFMRLMFEAIRKSDPVSLRALMNADDPPSRQLADDMTHFLIDQNTLFQRVVQRFGERSLVDKAGPYGSFLLRDMEFEIMESPIKRQDDGSIEINDMPLHKNATGNYEIDIVAFQKKSPDIGDSLKSMRTVLEKAQKQLLENKNLTLDKLIQSLEKP